MAGHAQLAHHEDVEGRAEARRHLEAHRHPAAGQRENHRRLRTERRRQHLGEVPSRRVPVGEDHAWFFAERPAAA